MGLGRVIGLLCVVCAFMACPAASAADDTNTVVVTFNGFDASSVEPDAQHVNLDCSAMSVGKPYEMTAESSGVKFQLESQVYQHKDIQPLIVNKKGKGLLLKNQVMKLSLDGSRPIRKIYFVYGPENEISQAVSLVGLIWGNTYDASRILPAKTVKEYSGDAAERTFLVPTDLSKHPNHATYLQAAVITYSGDKLNGQDNGNGEGGEVLADEEPAAEVAGALPTISGVKISVKNGDAEVKAGEKVPAGTMLNVTLTPADVKNRISEVKSGDATISGTTAPDGSWTGSVAVERLAALKATMEVKTFSVSIKTDGTAAAITLYDATTGKEITDAAAVAYGTNLGIAVSGYGLDKELSTPTGTVADLKTLSAGGKYSYTIVVKDNLDITLHFADKKVEKAQVNFPDVTGGTITVVAKKADGTTTTLTSGMEVARGTELTITLTPAAGYAVDGLTIEGVAVAPAADGTYSYTIPADANTVIIAASFVKIFTVTWQSVQGATIVVKNSAGGVLTSPATVKNGETVTVTITPDNPTHVTDLTANGKKVSPTANKNEYRLTITEDTELVGYAGKQLQSYQLKLNSATGASIKLWDNATHEGNPILSGSGSKSIKEGTALYGTVTVTGGYKLDKIAGRTSEGEDEIAFTTDATGATFGFNMPSMAYEITPVVSRIMPERDITVTIPADQASMGSVSYKIGADGSETAYTAPFKAKQGEVVTFTITATAGHRIKSVAPSLSYTTNTDTEKVGTYTVGASNATITVNFEAIPERTLTLTGIKPDQLPAGIQALDVAPGLTNLPEGSEVTFTLKADSEYKITSFTVGSAVAEINDDGSEATAKYTVPKNVASPSVALKCTVTHRMTNIVFRLNNTNVTGMGSVSAVYKVGTATKSISPTTTTESQNVPTDTKMSVVAKPNSGYVVESLTINGTSVDLANVVAGGNVTVAADGTVTVADCYTTPKADGTGSSSLTVDVAFKEKPVYYAVTLSVAGGNALAADNPYDRQYGKVDFTPAGTDLKKVLKGTTLTFTATPYTNYQIKSITVNGKAQEFDITAGSHTFAVDVKGATTVSVVFEARTYRVQVFASPADGGTPYVSAKGTTVASFSNGARVTISAPANPGYEFEKWLLNGQNLMDGNRLAGATYSFTMPLADQRFTAVYKKATYRPHEITLRVAQGQGEIGEIAFLYPTAAEGPSWITTSTHIVDWTGMVKVGAKLKSGVDSHRYFFDKWTVSGGGGAGSVTDEYTEGDTHVYEYGGNNNITITANFGQNYLLTLVKPVNGTMEVKDAEGNLVLDGTWLKKGTRLTVTLTPNKLFNVSCLVINDREQTHYNRPSSVTINVVIDGDTTLKGIFYNPSGIEDVTVGGDEATGGEPEQWFSITGQYIGTERPTAAGVYIRRCGREATKVVVR